MNSYHSFGTQYSEVLYGYPQSYYESEPLSRYASSGGSSQASSMPDSPGMSHGQYSLVGSPVSETIYEDYVPSSYSQASSSSTYAPAAPRTDSGKDWPVSCLFPGCNSRPFRRLADLQRHINNMHAPEKVTYPCDYPKCIRKREPFHRRDHFREHLRDYHREDIGKRGATMDAEWLKDRNLSTQWWRCPRCLVRVYIVENGFECYSCKTRCETVRKEKRETSSDSLKRKGKRRNA